MEAAVKKGIPVVIIDSGLEESPAVTGSDKYLGYVATDNREGGRRAAERLHELLRGKERPRVLMLRYQAGSESTEQREAGFIEKMKSYPGVQLIVPPDELKLPAKPALFALTSAVVPARRSVTNTWETWLPGGMA